MAFNPAWLIQPVDSETGTTSPAPIDSYLGGIRGRASALSALVAQIRTDRLLEGSAFTSGQRTNLRAALNTAMTDLVGFIGGGPQ